MEIRELCGLTNLSERKTTLKWYKARLRFIGAEGYELRSKIVEVRFITVGGCHISLVCKVKLEVEADWLLGKHKQGRLYDVLVETDMLTLSIASLLPERYPVVLRTGETIELFS